MAAPPGRSNGPVPVISRGRSAQASAADQLFRAILSGRPSAVWARPLSCGSRTRSSPEVGGSELASSGEGSSATASGAQVPPTPGATTHEDRLARESAERRRSQLGAPASSYVRARALHNRIRSD
jgi:hypothetical protein